MADRVSESGGSVGPQLVVLSWGVLETWGERTDQGGGNSSPGWAFEGIPAGCCVVTLDSLYLCLVCHDVNFPMCRYDGVTAVPRVTHTD